MNFKVPQHLDIEDKVFGPFSFVQFIYIIGGAGIVLTLWRFLPPYISIFIIIPVVSFTWALVYFPKKKYGSSFVSLLESAFVFFTKAKVYTWKKVKKKNSVREKLTTRKINKLPQGLELSDVSDSNLQNLSWSVDVNETKDSSIKFKK